MGKKVKDASNIKADIDNLFKNKKKDIKKEPKKIESDKKTE